MFDDKLIITMFSVLVMGMVFSFSARASMDDDKVLADVNGSKITNAMLMRYQKRRGIPKDTNPQQQTAAMLEELINRELIYQDALNKGLDKDAKVKAEINNQRVNIIASAMLKNTAEKNKISDKQLRMEYDVQAPLLGKKEYHARHILLTTEKDAKDVIAQLAKGEDFAALAKSESTGPSKDKGGGLGWFSGNQMVKPFTEAVATMKKGEHSKKPVKTQFGWHVIKLEDTRDIPPPAFEAMKEQLRMRMQNKGVENYIAKLRSKAKINKN